MYELFGLVLHSKLFFLILILFVIYFYFKFIIYSFWRKLGVPHDEPTVPFGSVNSKFIMKKINMGNFLKQIYEKYKSYPYYGFYMFHAPVLMINDLDLIKQILVKDFSNFCDRGLFCNEKIDPLVGHLFSISGEKWRILRVKLSPTFTSGKLKQMFPLLMEIANEMNNTFDHSLRLSKIVDVKDLLARYTTDTTFSLAFGFDSQTLKHPDNQFYHYGQLSYKQNEIKAALTFFAPSVMNALSLPVFDPKVTEFFTKLFLDMIEKRKSENRKRNDFLNLLIELIDKEQTIDTEILNSTVANDFNAEKVVKKLDPLVAAAQAFVFFIAGIETSSSLVSHCLYELSLHPDIQKRLQDEIDNHLHASTVFSYENLNQMEYLDMVLKETARKHSSLPFLNRECKENYKIANSNFIVPKGMRTIISVSGLHHDPDFYPDPEKFDPMRFNKQNTANRNPFSYLPFGEGPRVCIGKRLGVMQSKVALATLMSSYKFSVCEKTKIPNEYSTETVFQAPKGSLYLQVEKRKI